MKWVPDSSISRRVKHLAQNLFPQVDPDRIFCFSSSGSVSRATARIWSLPQIWQLALNLPPGYCLEIISEKFNRLSLAQQEKVLIHELMHIPKKFSGHLVAHRSGHRKTFRQYHHTVESYFKSLITKSYEI